MLYFNYVLEWQILISEVVVDWLKHAFITKFNRIPLSVYGQFKAVLRHDLTSSRTRSQRKVLDHTHLLSRRLGLPNIPLACVTLRILFLHLSDRSWKFNTLQTCIILSLLFSCMIAFKTLLGLWLLVHSSLKLQDEGFQRLDKGGNYSPTAVSKCIYPQLVHICSNLLIVLAANKIHKTNTALLFETSSLSYIIVCLFMNTFMYISLVFKLFAS